MRSKNIVVSSSPPPSPLPSARRAAPVARGQQQRAVKRPQLNNGAVRPCKKRMSRVVENEETDEEDGDVPLPQQEEDEEEEEEEEDDDDDDDDFDGVLLGDMDDGLGDDDYDDDEDCVDLEELDLTQHIGQADLAELVDEETDEEEVSVPARARGRAPSVRRRVHNGKLHVMYRADDYSALDVGSSALPESFTRMSLAEKETCIRRARQFWIQYFKKTKAQATDFDSSNPDSDFPFCNAMANVLRSRHWTAERLAVFVLSGKDEYGKYLDSLGRLPTEGELKAIPAPTPEQLQGLLVYTDLIERDEVEYRYGGSGTSQKGGGSRLRGYEMAKRLVMSGHSAEPKLDIVSHMNVLLQRDSKAFWRLRASYSHSTTTPILVAIAEAAIIDSERTMSEDVPPPGNSAWYQVHSLRMLNKSKARFPDGKNSGRAFVGLNRASPYKQGNCGVGNRKHRLAVFKAAGMKCSCCQRVTRASVTVPSRVTRLSWEVSLFYEGVTTMCGQCVKEWHKSSNKSAEDFVSERRHRCRKKNVIHAIKASNEAPTCCICNQSISKYKEYNQVFASSLAGYIDQPICNSCDYAWRSRYGPFKKMAPERDDPVVVQAFADRRRSRGQRPFPASRANKT